MKRRWRVFVVLAVISTAGAISSAWEGTRPVENGARATVASAAHDPSALIGSPPIPDVGTLTLVAAGAAVAFLYQRRRRNSHHH
jgi:hypothetical protein